MKYSTLDDSHSVNLTVCFLVVDVSKLPKETRDLSCLLGSFSGVVDTCGRTPGKQGQRKYESDHSFAHWEAYLLEISDYHLQRARYENFQPDFMKVRALCVFRVTRKVMHGKLHPDS